MQISVLNNGLTVITEHHEQAVSTLLCYWVKAGGHYETDYPYGVAHFLEHMMFKGTLRRTKDQISEDIEDYGGRLNAATGSDRTRYYAYTPYDQWKQGVDLLTDMVFHSSFPDREIALEKKVIIEEIKRANDNPSEYGGRLIMRLLRGLHPERAGNLGTEETVYGMTRDDLLRFHRHFYRPSNMVLVATGHIDHDALVEYLQTVEIPKVEPLPVSLEKLKKYELSGQTVHETRDIRQAQLHIGMYGPDSYEDDKFAGFVAMRILGGGHGSRLWRHIRGDKGLAYEVRAGISPMTSEGFLTGYVATDPVCLQDVKAIVVEEIERMRQDRITDEELGRAKNAITGLHLIAQDHPESVNASLAARQLYGVNPDPHYFVKRVRSITTDEVLTFAQTYLSPDRTLFVQVSREANATIELKKNSAS